MRMKSSLSKKMLTKKWCGNWCLFALVMIFAAMAGCEKAKPIGSTGGGKSSGGKSKAVEGVTCKEFCTKFMSCQKQKPQGPELEMAISACVGQCKATPIPPNPEGKILAALMDCTAKHDDCGGFHSCASEAFKKLSAELEPKQEDPDAVYKVPLDGAPSVGAEHGLVTIVGFLDVGCGYCGKGHEVMRKLLAKHGDKLRIVFRDFPLGSPSSISFKAAEAAYSVYEQKGKKAYWDFQEKVFTSDKMDEERLIVLAKEAGAEAEHVKKDLKNRVHKEKVKKNIEIGRRFGVEGTPTFFVNGQKIPGFIPLEGFEKIYQAALSQGEALLEKGTARKNVYSKLTEDGETKVKYLEKGEKAGGPKKLDPEATFKVPIDPAYPHKGTSDALVTIVVFSDFQCPHSRRLSSSLDMMVKKYPKEVRLVFRNLPLPMHPRAYDAAEASLAVFRLKGVDAFWLFHNKLFQNQDDFSPAALEKLVKEVGVDVEAYRKARVEHTYRPQVRSDLAFAQKLGIEVSPQMFINGKALAGAVSLQKLTDAVERELKNARELVKSGVAQAKVYDKIMESAKEEGVFVK